MAKSRFKAIANLVVEVLLIINMVLTATGRTPLPVDEQGVMEVVYGLLTGLQTLRVWWYNQNMTVEADTAQEVMEEMKNNRDKMGPESDLEDPGDCEAE